MRHSQLMKEQVRALRAKGFSLGQISKQVDVAKTTVQSWVEDVVLTEEQKKNLAEKAQSALQNGRVNAQSIKKSLRLEKEKLLVLKGQEDIGVLSDRDLFIAGIALYWAEGFKNRHEHRLGFCNSDPYMIIFYILWLKKVFKVSNKDIVARLTINVSYKERVREIESYWSELTGIPKDQFTKTFYQNTQWKKEFVDDNYKGVLRIHVKESLEQLWSVKGWIEALRVSLPR